MIYAELRIGTYSVGSSHIGSQGTEKQGEGKREGKVVKGEPVAANQALE